MSMQIIGNLYAIIKAARNVELEETPHHGPRSQLPLQPLPPSQGFPPRTNLNPPSRPNRPHLLQTLHRQTRPLQTSPQRS